MLVSFYHNFTSKFNFSVTCSLQLGVPILHKYCYQTEENNFCNLKDTTGTSYPRDNNSSCNVQQWKGFRWLQYLYLDLKINKNKVFMKDEQLMKPNKNSIGKYFKFKMFSGTASSTSTFQSTTTTTSSSLLSRTSLWTGSW